jgi:hypothetical protein
LEPLRTIATLDTLLQAHAGDLGDDLTPYRNHTYRIANLAIAAAGEAPDAIGKIAIAAAFHDIGVWTDRTFDYIEPSVRRANAYLKQAGRADWTPEITEMIRQHHKIRRYRDAHFPLVEPFRRADWADVTFGLIASGPSRRFLRDLYAIWPDAGFHLKLVRLSLRQFVTHPLNPLPMFRL